MDLNFKIIFSPMVMRDSIFLFSCKYFSTFSEDNAGLMNTVEKCFLLSYFSGSVRNEVVIILP